MKAFIESQSGRWTLIWVLISRSANNKIKHLPESSLQIAYKDNISSFED